MDHGRSLQPVGNLPYVPQVLFSFSPAATKFLITKVKGCSNNFIRQAFSKLHRESRLSAGEWPRNLYNLPVQTQFLNRSRSLRPRTPQGLP